jgi:thiamine biosynthesis lipoprotein
VDADVLRRSWVEQIMGMPISVLARGDAAHAAATQQAVEAVFAELRGVDEMFSTYKPDSVVSRLARREVVLDESPPGVREVAWRCQQAKERTGGLFDATRPDGVWDPSGLVKGWAAARAARHLRDVDGLDWCLNAGGDVVVGSPSGLPFVIGIQDPSDPQRVVTTVARTSGALATSGTAARGTHIYDPRTREARPGRWLSVSVIGPSLETADVLATAAFVAGDAWAQVVASVPGYDGLAISGDLAMTATLGWPSHDE